MRIVENPNLWSTKTGNERRHTFKNPPNDNLFSVPLPLLYLYLLFNKLLPLLKNHTLSTLSTLSRHLPLRSSITHSRTRLLSRHSKRELILLLSLLRCIPLSSSLEYPHKRFPRFTETGANFTKHDTCAGCGRRDTD